MSRTRAGVWRQPAITPDVPREAMADTDEVAAAVAFLVNQGPRGLTHDLVVIPAGERWVP